MSISVSLVVRLAEATTGVSHSSWQLLCELGCMSVDKKVSKEKVEKKWHSLKLSVLPRLITFAIKLCPVIKYKK